jgi:mRNA-degrading endonuclease YafQ of YafQ-DinJ toxin-antitoxin module
MRHLKTTKRFERDLKRIKKRGKQLDRLWFVVESAGDLFRPLWRRSVPGPLTW